MPTYTYKARDEAGKAVTGTLEAPSREEVAAKLHKMGYLVTRVEQGLAASLHVGSLGERLQGVRTEDLILFTVQLANMVGSGLPLLSGLKILRDQMETKQLKRIAGEIARNVEAGSSLSEALALHPRIFSRLFVHMAKAGEATGRLGEVLHHLAAYLEYQEELRQKIKGALFYPTFLLAAGIAVALFVVSFVIPQFVEIFSKANIPLPLPTQILYAVGTAMKRYWYLVLSALGALVLAARWVRRTDRGEIVIDRISLHLVAIGPLVRKISVSRFARTMGMLVGNGVPMLQSLEIVEEVVGNRVIGQVVREARNAVEGGSKLAEPLKVSGEFPLDTVQMIAVGEETGELEGMLNKISEFYDRAVGYSIAKLMILIEPACLMVMGGMVAFIMASLLLPVFDMVKTIHR